MRPGKNPILQGTAVNPVMSALSALFGTAPENTPGRPPGGGWSPIYGGTTLPVTDSPNQGAITGWINADGRRYQPPDAMGAAWGGSWDDKGGPRIPGQGGGPPGGTGGDDFMDRRGPRPGVSGGRVDAPRGGDRPDTSLPNRGGPLTAGLGGATTSAPGPVNATSTASSPNGGNRWDEFTVEQLQGMLDAIQSGAMVTAGPLNLAARAWDAAGRPMPNAASTGPSTGPFTVGGPDESTGTNSGDSKPSTSGSAPSTASAAPPAVSDAQKLIDAMASLGFSPNTRRTVGASGNKQYQDFLQVLQNLMGGRR